MHVRTTLEIEDDVLQAARELAENRGTSIGKVISELVRAALESPRSSVRVRQGVPLIQRRRRGSRKPTLDLVNRLRDEA
jgi:hypothetical protein